LPDIDEVAATGDFFDQNGSEPFRPELLVNAEEVDLDRVKGADDYE
jgi:hypothetical protein